MSWSACVSTVLRTVLLHTPASCCGSSDGPTGTSAEELVVGSIEAGAEGGGWLAAGSGSRWDEVLAGVSDGGTAGPSEGSGEEELDVVLTDRSDGISEGESESMSGRGSEGESANRSVGFG